MTTIVVHDHCLSPYGLEAQRFVLVQLELWQGHDPHLPRSWSHNGFSNFERTMLSYQKQLQYHMISLIIHSFGLMFEGTPSFWSFWAKLHPLWFLDLRLPQWWDPTWVASRLVFQSAKSSEPLTPWDCHPEGPIDCNCHPLEASSYLEHPGTQKNLLPWPPWFIWPLITSLPMAKILKPYETTTIYYYNNIITIYLVPAATVGCLSLFNWC